MKQRVGIGYDVHKFCEGRKLVLGGVEIPHGQGLEGHSDADVVLHAVCDALLGALGQGDIGDHFPNTDEKYRNISSVELLKEVYRLVQEASYKVGNVDIVIQAETPQLSFYKQKMKFVIAYELDIEESCVNIKATTNEGLGFIGNKEGIASYAVAIIVKKIMDKF